jgi:hypothetical protein
MFTAVRLCRLTRGVKQRIGGARRNVVAGVGRYFSRCPSALLLAAACCALGSGGPALARTWLVGPDQALKKPSEAARRAADGDVVQIEPQAGGYYDCAIWHRNKLTIEGTGDDVRITDTTCQGKALFVIAGNDVTIRNLTFARARVADGNGAGIRAEGGNLHIENSRFVDNEVAILASDHPGAMLEIKDSRFSGNGTCRATCLSALSVGAVAILRIENSIFMGNKGRDTIRSLAARTELIGNEIQEGAAATGYLVELPDGGSLVLERNSLHWHSGDTRADAAVFAAAGCGAPPTEQLTVRNNVVRDGSGGNGAVLLLNWTGREAMTGGNKLPAGTRGVATGGYYAFVARSCARAFITTARGTAHRALAGPYHFIRRLLGR